MLDNPVNAQDNVNELIRNALRRGSVTSNFNNQILKTPTSDKVQAHNAVQKTIRTLSVPDIYKPPRELTNQRKDSSSTLGKLPPLIIPSSGNVGGMVTLTSSSRPIEPNYANISESDQALQLAIEGTFMASEGNNNNNNQSY